MKLFFFAWSLSISLATSSQVESDTWISNTNAARQHDNDVPHESLRRLQNAIHELQQHGGFQICRTDALAVDEEYDDQRLDAGMRLSIPQCRESTQPRGVSRLLGEETLQEFPLEEEGGEEEPSKPWYEESSEQIINGIGAVVCISIAALAAGLTLGMLGMDPLLLLIKQRASDDPMERKRATTLLPIVKQHHRLLVTLLLMNAVANEALPIFLEALVPPSLAILFSVVFVLFFGEIIPSAIFTGPNQMKIASNLVPVVKAAMCLLYPVAMPIAKLLDWVLHDEDADDAGMYNRGELSALIRIQYEERMASKRKRKMERAQHLHSKQVQLLPDGDRIGALDFSCHSSMREHQRESVRANKSHVLHNEVVNMSMTSGVSQQSSAQDESNNGFERSNSIHIDEVTMVEGALSMKMKVALDEFTPLRQVFSIPDSALLTEKGIVKIYASGFSRVPVYKEDVHNSKKKTNIVGVLLCKQLMVCNPDDKRPVSSMPLYTPFCVGPNTPLVDLVNLFQSGGRGMKGGHMALVCARPKVGNAALGSHEALPDSAGLMGIITLEDVLEALLQEKIYDENDKYERDALALSKMVIRRWRRYIERKKKGLLQPPSQSSVVPAIRPVVEQAMAAEALEEGRIGERTSLLNSTTKK